MFREITMIDYSRPLPMRRDTRRVCGPYRWSPSEPGKGWGFYSSSRDALEMDRAGSSLSLRLEWANDHLGGSRLSMTSGYFCDHDGEGDTLQPIIARLPHGRGFLAGWTMGEGMCGALGGYVWETEEEAARAAHDMVEADAERNREALEEMDEEAEDEDTAH